MKTTIEKGYGTALLIVTLFVIGENLLSLIFTKKPSAIFHISLAMIILIALAIKSKYSKILVKLWAIISIIGGLLVVISTLMFWIGGAPERINYESLLVSIIHILVGSYFYYYSDRSIKVVKAI